MFSVVLSYLTKLKLRIVFVAYPDCEFNYRGCPYALYFAESGWSPTGKYVAALRSLGLLLFEFLSEVSHLYTSYKALSLG